MRVRIGASSRQIIYPLEAHSRLLAPTTHEPPKSCAPARLFPSEPRQTRDPHLLKNPGPRPQNPRPRTKPRYIDTPAKNRNLDERVSQSNHPIFMVQFSNTRKWRKVSLSRSETGELNRSGLIVTPKAAVSRLAPVHRPDQFQNYTRRPRARAGHLPDTGMRGRRGTSGLPARTVSRDFRGSA